MASEKIVKVKFLRIHDTGDKYYKPGDTAELPESRAKALAAGQKPTVVVLKG